MNEWIHVVSDTKVPTVRTGASPFEKYSPGFDPNDSTAFGPDRLTMFLPVRTEPVPATNPVTERAQLRSTVDTEGNPCAGWYVDPEWVIEYEIVSNDIATARLVKLEQLASEKAAYIAQGYAVGQFLFPLTEEFFRHLAGRLDWLERAVADGTVPSDHTITFSDLNGKEVARSLTALTNQFTPYGFEYTQIAEIAVRATDNIEAASTPAEVDAVTWVFGA